MQCPGCGAENPADGKKCVACGERLKRRPPRADLLDESDSPFSNRYDPRHWAVIMAYRCAVFSLIPLAGLVLGPVAMGLAVAGWWRGRRDPAARRPGLVRAALFLGAVTFVLHGLGLALMLQGLGLVP